MYLGNNLSKHFKEYLEVLHNIYIRVGLSDNIDELKFSKKIIIDTKFARQNSNYLESFDSVLVYDWFNIDDFEDNSLFDLSNVTFCSTNMIAKMENAKVITYNFMRNRSLLAYTQIFPIYKKNRNYYLLLLEGNGLGYNIPKFVVERNNLFLFLNAKRKTYERDTISKSLKNLNGIITSKNKPLPNDDVTIAYKPLSTQYWEDSYYNIVIETNTKDHNIVHTTEKIWEPFIKYQIPIVLATKQYQKYLENLGFVFPIPVFTNLEEYKNFLIDFFSYRPIDFFMNNLACVQHNHKNFFKIGYDNSINNVFSG